MMYGTEKEEGGGSETVVQLPIEWITTLATVLKIWNALVTLQLMWDQMLSNPAPLQAQEDLSRYVQETQIP